MSVPKVFPLEPIPTRMTAAVALELAIAVRVSLSHSPARAAPFSTFGPSSWWNLTPTTREAIKVSLRGDPIRNPAPAKATKS